MKNVTKIANFLKQAYSAKDFISKLEQEVKKSFPKSMVNATISKGLGKSITLRVTLGKDKSEYANGIIHNDPMYHVFMIAFDQIDKEDNLSDKISVEISLGGSLEVPSKNPRLAYDRIKLGWRKKSDTPDKIINYIGKYFQKAKGIVQKHKDELPKHLQNKV